MTTRTPLENFMSSLCAHGLLYPDYRAVSTTFDRLRHPRFWSRKLTYVPAASFCYAVKFYKNVFKGVHDLNGKHGPRQYGALHDIKIRKAIND